ncbi:MAG: nitrate reductase [Deltaproteobacteria bacterium]|nr:nitrate reductase [Deltaproteobacteria bacterium]
MFEFVRGPLVWIAFIVFVGGVLYRLVSTAILAGKEKTVFPTMDLKYGLRSLMHWIVPFANRNTRMRPIFTVVSFAFHICLLATPMFLMGHAVLWKESWGVSWWSLPPATADVMTLVVVFGCVFFVLRRLTSPEVRNVTTWKDYALVLLVVSPFITGYAAHQQWLDARAMLILHIICGALWLVAIPFTRLSHMIWFAFSRAYMGSEFGAVRNARDW